MDGQIQTSDWPTTVGNFRSKGNVPSGQRTVVDDDGDGDEGKTEGVEKFKFKLVCSDEGETVASHGSNICHNSVTWLKRYM